MNLQTFLDGNGLVAIAVLVGLAIIAITLHIAFKNRANNAGTIAELLAENPEIINDAARHIPEPKSKPAGKVPEPRRSKPAKQTSSKPATGKITRNRLTNARVARICDKYVAGKMSRTIAKEEGVDVKVVKSITAGKSYQFPALLRKHSFPLKQTSRMAARPVKSRRGLVKQYADWAFVEIKNAGTPLKPIQLSPLLRERMREIGYVNADSDFSTSCSIAKAIRHDKRFVNDGTGTYGIRVDLK